MHKYNTEKSHTSNWKKNLSSQIGLRVFKNQRRAKPHLAETLASDRKESIYDYRAIAASSHNFHVSSPKVTSPTFSAEKSKSNKKLDILLSKISNPPEMKNLKNNEQFFRRSITKSIQNLENAEVPDFKEQKNIIKNFSESVKTNMFSITKNGIKFRVNHLRKQINAGFNRKGG